VSEIQPELGVSDGRAALAFYRQAFGAEVLHQVGDEEIVAQLQAGGARFWISDGPRTRMLLVADDPDALVAQAVAAGARELAAVHEEHGWRLGRIEDPFGWEWEIGRPLGGWPPRH
jgi:PhnB protein